MAPLPRTAFWNSGVQGNEMEIGPYKIGAELDELRCSGWVTCVWPSAATATFIQVLSAF